MYLKRLDIHGFKTFAQRATFVFPQGITAVVGPNGSGKSNLSDAVRWVLGEQSFANLRCKKTEDLIYSGGKGRAPLGFAEVYLTIDNGDRLLPLPYDEVTIGRRAYRNGDNEYFINRARVRLRDLLDAVAPLGSSYTLINQGLVDAALALHPEDRQKLFEDAAEIGPYQTKQAEAERRLREAEANLLRLSDLLQEEEPRLRTLKRQARDAEAVGVVEAELQSLLAEHYRALLEASALAVCQAEAQGRACSAELEISRRRRAEAVALLTGGRDLVRERRAELTRLREAEAAVDRRLADTLRERAVVAERLVGLQERHDELREREQHLREERARRAAELEGLERDVERAAALLVTRRSDLAARQHSAADTVAALRAAEAGLASAQSRLARAMASAGAVEARHDQLRRQLAASDRDLLTNEADLQRDSVALETATAAVSGRQDVLSAADAALRTAEAALDAAQNALRGAREARERVRDDLAAARRTQGDLQARFDTLARLVQSSAFPGVRAAMQWAARSGHDDFKLVASIVNVPPELETAVEVVLGGRLQQIVVDRWESAEAAIEELRRARAGRATFLPLDSLRPSRRAPGPDLPGILGRAADMVDAEQRYAPVVELLLGRTLIATDLASARATLRQLDAGWGIVTLAGEQVAASGVLTGGSASREAGTLRREREYRDLPRQIEQSQAEVVRLTHLLDAQSGHVEQGVASVRSAERALEDTRRDRGRRQTELEAARRELHRCEDNRAASLKRSERLTSERQTVQHMLAGAGSELEQARAAVREAQGVAEAAARIHEERRHAARAEDASMQAVRAAVLGAEADHRTLEERLRRHKRELAEAEEEQAVIGQRLAQMDAELRQLGSETAGLAEREGILGGEVRELAGRIQPLEAELRDSEDHLQGLEEVERTATAAMLEAERKHADAVILQQSVLSNQRVVAERAAADGLDPDALAADPQAQRERGAGLEPRIEQLRARLRRMGPVNSLAPAEYRALEEHHDFLQAQLNDVRMTIASLRDAIRELDGLMASRFRETFDAVAREFSQTFTQLFGGGTAHLSLVGQPGEDGSLPREGVEIVAQPPGKRQMHLQLLSGGERALTAAALLFAILKHQPRPFCIMDEVDAALDEANVVRFREALLDLASRTQFIVVTHNRGTVEAASTLYGISMGADGASRSLSLRLVDSHDERLAVNQP